MTIDNLSSSSASEVEHQYGSSDEELECQRVCDYSCENAEEFVCCQEPDGLEEMAMNSKLLLFALVPMIGRQLGSIFARRGIEAYICVYLSFCAVLRRLFGSATY
jgi:hypothetical protein